MYQSFRNSGLPIFFSESCKKKKTIRFSNFCLNRALILSVCVELCLVRSKCVSAKVDPHFHPQFQEVKFD